MASGPSPPRDPPSSSSSPAATAVPHSPSSDQPPPPPAPPPPHHHPPSSSSSSTQQLSRYESQKRRDWNTFLQYLKNHKPPLTLPRCSGAHVIEFLKYLDQFGKTKVHAAGCAYFGQPNPPAPCACPLKQAWGSLDALIGRLRAAYEENDGKPETNPFGARAVRMYLREVRESQAKARGIPYEKKKRKRPPPAAAAALGQTSSEAAAAGGGEASSSPAPSAAAAATTTATAIASDVSGSASAAEGAGSSSGATKTAAADEEGSGEPAKGSLGS